MCFDSDIKIKQLYETAKQMINYFCNADPLHSNDEEMYKVNPQGPGNQGDLTGNAWDPREQINPQRALCGLTFGVRTESGICQYFSREFAQQKTPMLP